MNSTTQQQLPLARACLICGKHTVRLKQDSLPDGTPGGIIACNACGLTTGFITGTPENVIALWDAIPREADFIALQRELVSLRDKSRARELRRAG